MANVAYVTTTQELIAAAGDTAIQEIILSGAINGVPTCWLAPGQTLEGGNDTASVTLADGAMGVQISQPVGGILVRNGIETFGGTGPSLVKGVVITLSAIGLSIKPGGSAKAIEIRAGFTRLPRGLGARGPWG